MPDPLGEWLTAKGYARIRIVNCDGRLWGVVAWERRPGGIDDKNPDRSKRGRPTLGMPILLGMQQTRQNEWSGHIYNWQDGRTYSANISLLNTNTLKVQGCVFGILCGGENWTRVAEPDTNAAPARTGGPPARSGATSARPKGGHRAANPPVEAQNASPTDADICSGIGSSAGLSHERGLK